MDEQTRKQLYDAGINVDTAIERLMNNEGLFLRVLKKFSNDVSFEVMKAGIAANDAKKTFEGAHALKGVAGNLSLDSVLDVLLPVVETTRVGSMDGVEDALPELQRRYDAVCEAIAKLE